MLPSEQCIQWRGDGDDKCRVNLRQSLESSQTRGSGNNSLYEVTAEAPRPLKENPMQDYSNSDEFD